MILLAQYTKLFPIWFCLSNTQIRYSGHHSTTPGMRPIIHTMGTNRRGLHVAREKTMGFSAQNDPRFLLKVK